MFEDLLREYQKDNRFFVNHEFKGHLRDYMIELKAQEYELARKLHEKNKNKHFKTN